MAQKITFEKLATDGKAIAYWQDKACFVVGPVPGETAWIRLDRHHTSYVEGAVKRFTETSPQRAMPLEDHYLSCSPWQSLNYSYQLELKDHMLEQAYAQQSGVKIAEIVGAPAQLGYRNKLEFSFTRSADDRLSLAFHERGSVTDMIAAPDGCVLGHIDMNQAAIALLAPLNAMKVADIVQTVMVRRSHSTGEVIAVVYVTDDSPRDWSSLNISELAGVAVARRLGHNTHQVLWTAGKQELTEQVGGLELSYPWESFFQVYPAAFQLALAAIKQVVPKQGRVLDLYGGVGAIGLSLASASESVTGFELDVAATRLANANARANDIANYQARQSASESLEVSLFANIDSVILDPPRAGLHKHVIKTLLEAKPQQIIYLSCNPVTQARDLAKLSEVYDVAPITGFDFYPGTLHLESLAVLTRR